MVRTKVRTGQHWEREIGKSGLLGKRTDFFAFSAINESHFLEFELNFICTLLAFASEVKIIWEYASPIVVWGLILQRSCGGIFNVGVLLKKFGCWRSKKRFRDESNGFWWRLYNMLCRKQWEMVHLPLEDPFLWVSVMCTIDKTSLSMVHILYVVPYWSILWRWALSLHHSLL